MRLSFILSSLQLSGGVHVIVEYANRMVARGHQVALVYPGGTADATMRIGLDAKVQTIASKVSRQSTGSVLNHIRVTLSLARAVPASDFVIATHTPTTLASGVAGHLLRRGRPMWLFQDYIEMFDDRPLERILLLNALRWHDTALAISRPAQAELRSYVSGDVRYIGEGLSHAELFVPLAERPSAAEPFQILSFADLRPRKGMDVFLAAAERLAASGVSFEVTLFGKAAVPIKTQSFSVRQVIRPNSAELARLYQTCDLFVSASARESFGLPTLEAMACGAPVVMTDSIGVHEYARDGENCLMVPAGDATQLATAMQRVLHAPQLMQKLIDQGVQTAAQYDWESAVNRFEDVLQSAHNTGRGK